jgi:hypothetical protein
MGVGEAADRVLTGTAGVVEGKGVFFLSGAIADDRSREVARDLGRASERVTEA